jgi:hypothetical protein
MSLPEDDLSLFPLCHNIVTRIGRGWRCPSFSSGFRGEFAVESAQAASETASYLEPRYVRKAGSAERR